MAWRKAISPDTAGELFGRERTLPLLRAAWPLAVGPRLAERTELLSLEGRTLIVRVPDARWRKILHRLRREILQRLAETAGPWAPRALGFAEAPSPPALPVEAAAPRESAGDRVAVAPPEVAKSALAIADVEVRSLFLEAAGRYLARGRAR